MRRAVNTIITFVYPNKCEGVSIMWGIKKQLDKLGVLRYILLYHIMQVSIV